MDFSPHFDKIFESLGVEAEYIRHGFYDGIFVTVLEKTPENMYESGETQSIGQVAELSLRKSEISRPELGDFLKIRAKVYKIFEEPLLDSTELLWKFQGFLVEK